MKWHPEELRIVGAVAPILLRMLAEKEENLWKRIHSEFKGGKTKFLPLIAEFSALRDQTNEITAALKQLQKEG